MDEQRMENKYNLTVSKIRKLKVGDREKLKEEELFTKEEHYWRQEKSVGDWEDFANGAEDLIQIRIYDEDAPEHAGEFWFEFYVYAGLSRYEFENFTDGGHVELHQEFLRIVNHLIDSGVLKLPAGE